MSKEIVTKTDRPAALPTFSDRQVEIIGEWSSAKSASEAASNLGISEHTYQTHLKRMRAKVGVHRTFGVFLHLQGRGLV